MADEQSVPLEETNPPLQDNGPYYGEPILAWEIDEYPRVERSRRWYILAGAAALALVVYALLTADFLFAVIILVASLTIAISSFTQPRRLEVITTTLGVVIGDRFYPYKSIKDFSIAYDPPAVKNLYLNFYSPLLPLLPVPLEDTDPNDVRACLGSFCPENLNRTQESLTERLRRVYKL